MSMSGIDWNSRLDEKYRQMNVLNDSQAAQNYADAYYKRQSGNAVPGLTGSQINQNNASAFQMRQEGNAIPFRAANDALNNQFTTYPTQTESDAAGRADYTDGLQELKKIISPFKRGTARVPGKGEGDKVPAMLEPGEAVLNKKAAGMIGRDKIAAANKKGNDARDKMENSRVAQLLMKMSRGMP